MTDELSASASTGEIDGPTTRAAAPSVRDQHAKQEFRGELAGFTVASFVPTLFSDAATVMAAIVRPVTQQTLAGDRRRHGRMVHLAAVASVIDSPLIAAHGEAASAAAPAGNASCAARTSRAHARRGVWGDGKRAPSAE